MDIIQYHNKIQINNRNTYALILPIVGCIIGLMIVILRVDVLTGVIGILFLIVCGVLVVAADERITVLAHDAPCTVTTKRILGGNSLQQTFTVKEIVKIEFVHGFTEKSWGDAQRASHIYLVLSNTDKVEVLMRYAIKPFSFPFRHNNPPVEEAGIISNFLGVPLETINMVSLKSGVKNFGKAIDPPQHDRTRTLLQAPTQEELDKEK